MQLLCKLNQFLSGIIVGFLLLRLPWPPGCRRWKLPSRLSCPGHCRLHRLVGPRQLRSRWCRGGLVAATGRGCRGVAAATGGRWCRVVAATGRLLSGSGPVDPPETPFSLAFGIGNISDHWLRLCLSRAAALPSPCSSETQDAHRRFPHY